MANTSRCVEPRGEDVTDATRCERTIGEARCADERSKSKVLRFREELESVADEDAILTAQRSDIGDRRERDEIEHAVDRILVRAHRARERQRELECDTDGGKILVRRLAAGTSRIEHRDRRWKWPAWKVMIRDDHVDAARLQFVHGAERAGAAVASHDNRRAGVT